MGILLLTVIGICSTLTYFLPTMLAVYKNHHSCWLIFFLNLFLGGTFVVWFVLIIMVAIFEKRPKTVAEPFQTHYDTV